jgi:uncharacterized protein YbbK (DUF523 family)
MAFTITTRKLRARAKLQPRILISSCLLGEAVRWDGSDARTSSAILDLWSQEGRLVPFCPEVAGDLPVPRLPAEIDGEGGLAVLQGQARVIDSSGRNATTHFVVGAHQALHAALDENIKLAVLKDGSPSCGSKTIHDGSFTGSKRSGQGVTAALLEQHGIRVFSEQQIEEAGRYLAEIIRNSRE